jgi:hypothetical protein
LRLPARPEVAHRWKVCGGYLSLLPAMLRDRWTPGRTVGRNDVMKWEVVKWPQA